MKTLRFIGMAIVAIIMSVNFVACSDDDDDNPIVGTWRSEVDNYGYSDSYTFNADGSGIWQEFKDNKQTDSESFKYSVESGDGVTVDGDKITFTWTDEVYTSTFSISGNRLTIKDNEDSETYTKQ